MWKEAAMGNFKVPSWHYIEGEKKGRKISAMIASSGRESNPEPLEHETSVLHNTPFDTTRRKRIVDVKANIYESLPLTIQLHDSTTLSPFLGKGTPPMAGWVDPRLSRLPQ
jgi:hypothetical protein